MTLAAWRRIQNSIHVTTAAATSIVMPSKICSYGDSSPPTVAKRPIPTARLSAMAAPAPIQIWREYRAFPVLAR